MCSLNRLWAQEALNEAKIESLKDRRLKLYSKFFNKALKHQQFSNLFGRNNIEAKRRTRSIPHKLKKFPTRCVRFANSPIPYLTQLPNSEHL